MLIPNHKEVSMPEGIFMNEKEIFRAEILFKIAERKLTQAQAAEQLAISIRQVRRLCKAYKLIGIKGLCSKSEGSQAIIDCLLLWSLESKNSCLANSMQVENEDLSGLSRKVL
jgi:hypothetical protein